MPLITTDDLEKISPVFRGRFGRALAKRLMKWTSMDRVCDLYDHNEQYEGAEFVCHGFDYIGLHYSVAGVDMLSQLGEGPFITISNHPYGSIDGMMLIDLFGHFRPDYRIMVNRLLSLIKTMRVNFIDVIPAGNEKNAVTGESIAGIKSTLSHLRDGHPLGLFPAGAVSDLSLRERCVRDRPWQKPILKLIQKARVPVVPVRFLDRNSNFYYFLGLLSWKIRVLRLPGEVFNKNNKPVRVAIGNIITPDEQSLFPDVEEFGQFLRRSVYELPVPQHFIANTEFYNCQYNIIRNKNR